MQCPMMLKFPGNFPRRLFASMKREPDKLPVQPKLLERLTTTPVLTVPEINTQPEINQLYNYQKVIDSYSKVTKLTSRLSVKHLKSTCFVHRPFDVPMDHLKVLLTGPSSIGKSVLLLQLVQSMKNDNWKVLYLPAISRWILGYYPYHSDNNQQFLQPTLASEICQLFSLINPSGINDAELINDPHQKLSKLLDQVRNDSKLVVVADEANALFSNPIYRDTNHKLIDISQLTIVQSIKDFVLHPNVRVIAAMDSTNPQLARRMSAQFHQIDIKPMTADQFNTIIRHYHDQYLFDTSQVHAQDYASYMHLCTSGIIGRLLPACQYSAVYRSKEHTRVFY